jgi:hypothetical protein
VVPDAARARDGVGRDADQRGRRERRDVQRPVERQEQERDRDGRCDGDRRAQLDQGRDRGLRSAPPIVVSTMPSLSA